MKCHSGSSDRATFFKGGSLSASSFKAVLFSVCLRLVPDTLGSGERDIDFLISDFSNDEVGCFACGGVDRPSGVPDRLRCAASVRKRAARLLGEITASAWHVAWYIWSKERQHPKSITKWELITYSIVLLHRILPHPIFIVFEEFGFERFFTYRTWYRFCLITRRDNHILSLQFSLTLDNLSSSSSFGI